MSIKNSYTLTISLFAITAFSGVVLSSTAFADTNTAQDNVSVSVPVSCTMNGTGMTSHTANIPNGTYESEIGTTTLKSFCNDSQGFAIYAIGYTNEEYGNTNLIGTSGGQIIVTGTATTTGNPDVSNWAVKLATDSTATYPLTLDNGFNAYSSVPSSYTKVAHRDSGTDLGSSATGATLTTTYAAYISKGQKADTYDGKVKFTLVHPSDADAPTYPINCEAGKICYNANAGDVVGAMGKQAVSNNDEVALWASNFSRSGYGFAGWSDTFDYSGNTYGPNQDITAPADVETNGLSLYAVWVESAGTLQNWSDCSGLAQGAVTALTDSRDNDTYAVAKLADGNCWMIENLRLDNTASHNTDGLLAQGYNSSFIGLAAPESADFDSYTTANSLYSTDGSTSATISGNNLPQRFPRYNNFNTNSRQSNSSYSEENNTYSYGNYYTWAAAIADTTRYSTDNQSITSTSLCPAGWHLPLGGSPDNSANSEFWNLGIHIMGFAPTNNAYYYQTYATNTAGDTSTKAFRKYPNNFIYSGLFGESSADNRGNDGYYWSSTTRTASISYDLLLDSSNVYPGANYFGRYVGLSIRCMLNP